ncbi:MAG: DUF3737 family protein [Lachnospiraceae bacterium]|nr:DUF3737 family protein [Lachnospiraceae bacterium]
MEEIAGKVLKGERALFDRYGLVVRECIFDEGESPLKESSDIELITCMFRWKYPLWYCKHINAKDCTWFDMARAGVWYTDDVNVENAVIQAPKNFRRCNGLKLKNVTFTDAKETLWSCKNVELTEVSAKGDYFAMNCEDLKLDRFTLDGNYSFDGVKNMEIKDSRLLSKDAFWNSENVTVRNSFISGEYLGWNSKNLTLIDCTIESLQGMCYIENLKMINCRLINTTLAFEYSSVEADIKTGIDSVLNPGSGSIKAEYIGELIIEKDRIEPEKTRIICDDIRKESDRPEWLR